MQYKVPQHIDMADRIVGPLTLIQFLYLLLGGTAVYFLFNTVAPVNFLVFMLLAVPIGFMSFAFAFLKIQDQPFPKFVSAFVVFLFRPKMRVWVKEGPDPNLIITKETVKKTDDTEHKTISKSQLEQLTQVLDTGGAAPEHRELAERQPKTKIAHTPPLNHLKKARPVLDNVKKAKS